MVLKISYLTITILILKNVRTSVLAVTLTSLWLRQEENVYPLRKLVAKNIAPKYQKEQTEREQQEALENTFAVFTEKWCQLKLQTVKQETADKGLQIL